MSRLPALELKARIAWIAECLRAALPPAYSAALRIILRALPPPLDPSRTDDDFGQFIHAPYAHFVAQYGCTSTHLATSLAALREVTQRFSAEDAIRAFLNAFPQQTMSELARWCRDSNYHVRRLCSEGTRPRLPWSVRLTLPPDAALPMLDVLHADRTRYVTRSVANHLNDIAKIEPDLVIAALKRWHAARRQTPKELDFITRHALRTLIKQGHEGALSMLGVDRDTAISLTGLRFTKHVEIGGALVFSFELVAPKGAAVVVDYAITFCKRDGAPGGRKVYKLRTCTLQKGLALAFEKKHPLRANMRTRPLYPGGHRLEILINGHVAANAVFNLRA
jgi:3-methyladenine DNA glycosylase AlkC